MTLYDVVGFLTCVALPTSVFYTSPVHSKVLPYIYIYINAFSIRMAQPRLQHKLNNNEEKIHNIALAI